jgi:hemerythrin
MSTIQWDQSMATGIDSVDAQHKQLIAWLNDLLAAISQGRARPEIQGLLDQLGTYAATHFGNEERCMARYKCPAAEQNLRQHNEFVITFTGLRDDYDRDGATANLIVRVEVELLRWLATHIKHTDAQLLPCVQAAQPKVSRRSRRTRGTSEPKS